MQKGIIKLFITKDCKMNYNIAFHCLAIEELHVSYTKILVLEKHNTLRGLKLIVMNVGKGLSAGNIGVSLEPLNFNRFV